MNQSNNGAGDNSKVSFSLIKKPKRPVTAEPPPPAFHEEEGKRVQKENRLEPLVIPLCESGRKTLLERKQEEKSQDELAADALTEQANLHFSSKDVESSTTNFSADGNLVIESAKNTNVTPVSSEGKEKQQYEKDMKSLPDAADENAYDRVPIAEFGAALLRGMGWKGKDKSDKTVPPPAMRPHRLGLGATPKLFVPDRPPGKIRTANQVKRDEKLQQQQAIYEKQHLERVAKDRQQTLQIGSIVQLNSRQRAKISKLVGVPGLNRVLVQIEGQATETSVKKGDLALVSRSQLIDHPFQETELKSNGSKSDTKYMGCKQEDNGIHNQSSEKHSMNDRRRKDEELAEKEDRSSASKKKRKREKYDGEKPKSGQTWLIPNIRVRVVTKKLGSRYYKEKGIVVDVSHRGAATLQLQSGRVLDRVPERYLETALPKAGGNAIILVGKSKYAKGKLLERSSRTGKGIIQIFEDMSVKTLSLDDIAEWVGPLDDDMME